MHDVQAKPHAFTAVWLACSTEKRINFGFVCFCNIYIVVYVVGLDNGFVWLLRLLRRRVCQLETPGPSYFRAPASRRGAGGAPGARSSEAFPHRVLPLIRLRLFAIGGPTGPAVAGSARLTRTHRPATGRRRAGRHVDADTAAIAQQFAAQGRLHVGLGRGRQQQAAQAIGSQNERPERAAGAVLPFAHATSLLLAQPAARQEPGQLWLRRQGGGRHGQVAGPEPSRRAHE